MKTLPSGVYDPRLLASIAVGHCKLIAANRKQIDAQLFEGRVSLEAAVANNRAAEDAVIMAASTVIALRRQQLYLNAG